MKRVYLCGACDAQFEAETSLFSAAEVSCPVCGKLHPRGEYAEINFCPHCQSEVEIPLDVPPGTLVTCLNCGGDFKTDRSGRYETEDFEEAEPESAEFSPGELFDKYEIIERLGKGGMGEVYLARHLLLKRQCALKILKSDACADHVASSRFLREAKLANRLTHPNIVAVTDVGTDFRTGRLFLAMEYVDGKNLAQIMRENGKFSENDALLIGNEVCKALEAMRIAGIVHRDIKPSNIMIDSSGHVKLMDLGIARSAESQEATLTLTQEQVVFGTPYYASPEQCRSAHSADHRSDLYSLGATLFHLVAGEPPFFGSDPLDTLVRVLREQPKDLRKLDPALSSGFVYLIKEMMAKEPEHRIATASEVQQRMEALLAGKRGNRLLYLSRIGTRIIRQGKRKRLLLIALSLLLFLIVVVLILALCSKTEKAADPAAAETAVAEVTPVQTEPKREGTATPAVMKPATPSPKKTDAAAPKVSTASVEQKTPPPSPKTTDAAKPKTSKTGSVDYRKLLKLFQIKDTKK